eukprot:TRINITY_DN3028_c0_g1_i1.p1 TRINITY_DN3028_c0_g1~~TRINITY_DN3028_c0_g1_i1.p1  ORF type:complete len:214 (-),score=65.43 TRINITY_DN3028_c0_g1_i1:236-877(-)
MKRKSEDSKEKAEIVRKKKQHRKDQYSSADDVKKEIKWKNEEDFKDKAEIIRKKKQQRKEQYNSADDINKEISNIKNIKHRKGSKAVKAPVLEPLSLLSNTSKRREEENIIKNERGFRVLLLILEELETEYNMVQRINETEYKFTKKILKDVATDTILYSRRIVLHEKIALWYEKSFAHDLQPYYFTIAQHWKKAGKTEKYQEYESYLNSTQT